ncbi:hypothetical protein AcV5_005663 [Taiwanofungus camphoratus]|nr:hypothetical protein AcV5_005663 [Antrodia cinnamomea]
MPTISLDVSYAKELVEFWGFRYREVKEELEALKNSHYLLEQQAQKIIVNDELQKLQGLITSMEKESERRQAVDTELRDLIARSGRSEEVFNRKVALLQKENEDLIARLSTIESEQSMLSQQVQMFYTQAGALATEAHHWRRDKIAQMFQDNSFVDENFESCSLLFDDPSLILRALPAPAKSSRRIYFVARPPNCMPLRVPSIAKSGYWFYPTWIVPDDAVFELVVEGKPDEWTYLGSYTSAPLLGYEMKLSEWTTLDDETKEGHCSRVTQQILAQSQLPAFSDKLDVKRHYDAGEWSVPCYSLRCTSFSMLLYNALHVAAKAVQQTN